MRNKELQQRVNLRREAYRYIFRPLLEQGRVGIQDARNLMNDFNFLNRTSDIEVREMFYETVILDEDKNYLIPVESQNIVINAAQLAIDDCNVELLNPINREIHETLRIHKSIAQKTINNINRKS